MDNAVPAPAKRRRFKIFGDAHDDMPNWVPRLLRQIALLIFLGFVAYNLFTALRGFLILLLISAFLAIALEPAVAFLAKRGWRRGLATAFIFAVVTVLGILFTALMMPLVVDQVRTLIDRAPTYVEQLSEFLANFGINFEGGNLLSAITSADSSLQGLANDLVGNAFGVGSTLLGTIFQGLTILLFTFYLTAEAPKLRRSILSTMDKDRQEEAIRIIEVAIDKTGGYFYSRTLLAAVAAFATWLALQIIGVPFAAPLAIWVGVLSQFVPVVGTYLGGVLPVLIALLESPTKAIWVIAFVVAYQQFENYIIGPRVTARTMSLHPAVAFGSVIVGGTLIGAPGTLMALPVAATVQALISTYFQRHALVESELFDEPLTPEGNGPARQLPGGAAQDPESAT
ncbi:MAG: AI-2E family transporter [Acidimicrobiia bacterium]|nr:AI-2E family transporter [Acidimicrobiia bacterium]